MGQGGAFSPHLCVVTPSEDEGRRPFLNQVMLGCGEMGCEEGGPTASPTQVASHPGTSRASRLPSARFLLPHLSPPPPP